MAVPVGFRHALESRQKTSATLQKLHPKVRWVCQCGVVLFLTPAQARDRKYHNHKCSTDAKFGKENSNLSHPCSEKTKHTLRIVRAKPPMEKVCKNCKTHFVTEGWEDKRRECCCDNCTQEWMAKVVYESNKRRDRGLTRLTSKIRNHPRYTEIQIAVFKRDGYRDFFSGLTRGKWAKPWQKIVLHHWTQLSTLIQIHDIKTIEEALACPAIWDMNNMTTMFAGTHAAYHDIYGKNGVDNHFSSVSYQGYYQIPPPPF
jgi:hypothetical protein